MTRRNKNLGDWGENQAVLFLGRHGFDIIDRNYHTTFGEIDIVACKNNDFYFIEVKTRFKGSLSDSSQISPVKQKKLQKTVNQYCFHKKIANSGIVLAGLMVEINKIAGKLNFNFFVLY